MKNSTPLTQKKCQPCEGTGQPFDREEALGQLKNIPGWQLDNSAKVIFREYKTKDFMAAVDFIQKVARVAEAENHHPDIHLTGYRKLKIELSTHAIGGLSENDLIVAAKINELDT